MKCLVCIVAASVSLVGACTGDGDDKGSGPALSREQARALGGVKADGTDLCEDLGFYGDREWCDCWCPSHDSDCDRGLPGSETCDEPSCPEFFCTLACGEFKKDEAGCSICECTDTGPVTCLPLACELACEEFKTDSVGCPICECADPVCSPVV
jgi:hypothetical protein